ncbi:hypothetical protein PR048_020465, partial [Dryococelus australis]
MEQRLNERAGETGDPRDGPPNQRHRPARFPHAKIRSDPAADYARIASVGGGQANRDPRKDRGPRWLSRYPARLPPRRTGFNPQPGHSGFSHVGIVPLVAESSRGSPASPAISFWRRSILTSITFICSQDLDVKSLGDRVLDANGSVFLIAPLRLQASNADNSSKYCTRDSSTPKGHRRPCVLNSYARAQFDSRLDHSRIFSCRNRAGRCRWSADFLGALLFPPLLHSDAAPYSPLFTLIGFQDLDVKNRPNLFTLSLKAEIFQLSYSSIS